MKTLILLLLIVLGAKMMVCRHKSLDCSVWSLVVFGAGVNILALSVIMLGVHWAADVKRLVQIFSN